MGQGEGALLGRSGFGPAAASWPKACQVPERLRRPTDTCPLTRALCPAPPMTRMMTLYVPPSRTSPPTTSSSRY